MTRQSWDGDEYQVRIDALAATGVDLHGEADLVCSYEPRSVLDAGCGTGRVAIELARRGVDVVGVDVDESMLATARSLAPDGVWVQADLTTVDLDRGFDVVLLAGNVPLFTPAGTEHSLVSRCSAHVAAGGAMVVGFGLGRGYTLEALDESCHSSGLQLEDRWATWERDAFDHGDYAVSVFRRPG